MNKVQMCLVVALTSLAVQAQTGDKTGGGIEKQIVSMEQKWAAAEKISNADAIAPMLAENFVIIFGDGKVMNKAQELEDVKKAKMEQLQVSDIKVTSYGNTAVATGTWYGKGIGGDGKPEDERERFVDTWHRMPDGKWQCIASGNTKIQ
jgi:ketosteroid isomerase-like protein